MIGLIGKKIGMTSFFLEDGRNIPCTVIQAGPCVVTQVKDEETDGYSAIQMGFGETKSKNTTKAQVGHFKKAGVEPKFKIFEFRDYDVDCNVGDEMKVDLFEVDDMVHVTARTKGKGFQGVVKRWNFKGVGDATHGQHNRQRSPGSIGMASTPSKVFKGMKMGGRTGANRVKIQNLQVVKIFPDKNLILIKGAIPGHKGSYCLIERK